MDTLQDIQQAIERLPAADRVKLERWFYVQAFEDEQEDDSADGEPGPGLRVEEPATRYDVARKAQRLSIDEYLRREFRSSVRHEYVAGEIFAMSGASRAHNKIAGNLFNAFSSRLQGGPCEVFMSDFKVRLEFESDVIFYYPDVMVACGRQGMEEYYLSHPKLIVEVLSPSTRTIDQREKALHYRHIPTLEEYVLVAQDRPKITCYRRSEDWQPQLLSGLDAVADFRSIELSLPLERIFAGVSATGL